MRHALPFIVLLMACGSSTTSSSSASSASSGTPAEAGRIEAGMKAPAMSLPTVDGQSKIEVPNPSPNAKVTVLAFWAMGWGGQYTLPKLNAFAQKYKSKGVDLFVVSHDQGEIDLASIIKENKLTFPMARDEGLKNLDHYRPRGVMSVYVIDKDGIVRLVVAHGKESSPISEPEVDAKVRELLGLPASPPPGGGVDKKKDGGA